MLNKVFDNQTSYIVHLTWIMNWLSSFPIFPSAGFILPQTTVVTELFIWWLPFMFRMTRKDGDRTNILLRMKL